MSYGITDAGFVKKDLQTIKTEEEARYKVSFGNDLDVSETSIAGQLIGNSSFKLANIWEGLQAIYNGFNPDKATGIALDAACALVGIVRLPAISSEVVCTLYGTQGTIIPTGNKVRQINTNENLTIGASTTIDVANCSDITFSVNTVLNSTLYTITINGTTFSYTSDGTATDIEIVAGLIADIVAGSEPITTVDNLDGTARIYSNDGKTAFSIVLDANLTPDEQGTPARYIADNTGAISIPLNTIQNIVTPVTGLDMVNNIAPGITGRGIETDVELRTRRRASVAGIGNATDESLRVRILQEVRNVTSVNVTSNRTNSVDGDGRPAKSFEVIVRGGDSQEIAEKIWQVQPSGIESYGNQTKTVIDSQGSNQTIKFSIPSDVTIWVEVDFELYHEEIFPTNGGALMKQAIVDWSLNEFDVGTDVINKRINIPIYSIPGIGDTTIRIGKTSGSEIEDDIVIAANEIAVFDITRISVAVV